jgi:hypothetical protein
MLFVFLQPIVHRFYARFIVVAILLRRMAYVRDVLVPELDSYVHAYQDKLSMTDANGTHDEG